MVGMGVVMPVGVGRERGRGRGGLAVRWGPAQALRLTRLDMLSGALALGTENDTDNWINYRTVSSSSYGLQCRGLLVGYTHGRGVPFSAGSVLGGRAMRRCVALRLHGRYNHIKWYWSNFVC